MTNVCDSSVIKDQFYSPGYSGDVQVGEQLNQASKTLSRTLISNPNIAENLNKIQKERRQGHTIFTITMAELRFSLLLDEYHHP